MSAATYKFGRLLLPVGAFLVLAGQGEVRLVQHLPSASIARIQSSRPPSPLPQPQTRLDLPYLPWELVERVGTSTT